MKQEELIERLREVVSRFCDPGPKSSVLRPPFDIKPPSAHSTKAEFLAEVRHIDQIMARSRGVIETIKAVAEADDPAGSLTSRLNKTALGDRPSGIAASATELVRGAAIDAGIFLSSYVVLLELNYAAEARKRELA